MMRTLRALNTGTFSSSGSLISSGDSTVMLTADKRYVQGGSSGHPSVGGDLMTATQKLKMKAVAFRRAWAHPGVGVVSNMHVACKMCMHFIKFLLKLECFFLSADANVCKYFNIKFFNHILHISENFS